MPPRNPVVVVPGITASDLRDEYAVSPDEPVPVVPFPYDWRQPLDVAERRLEAFVREVADRERPDVR